VEVGVSIPHFGPLASAKFVTDFCRRAEDCGFDGLWAAEHLVVPEQMESEYTLARRPAVISSDNLRRTMGLNLETLTTLAVAAAVTERVRLGTSVAVLPLRNPVLNARQLATIDQYSGGRLMYGVGVGWLKEEAEALGMPWDRRGARSEEHIAVLRTLWGAEAQAVGFDGDYYSFPPIAPDPRPTRMIPVLIGGHSSIALDRAARIGDGWIAAGMSPDRLAPALATLEDRCSQHGRPRSDLWVACSLSSSGLVSDDREALLDRIAEYQRLGVDHIQVPVVGSTPESVLDELERWGRDLLPQVP
jgi:probable F420-dependent oxidoreductase